MRSPIPRIAFGFCFDHVLSHSKAGGNGLDALMQGTMGNGSLIGFCENPAQERIEPIAGGHGIAGTGEIGFQLVGGIGLGVSA